MNPLWQQKNLRDFCEKNDNHVTAFSPLGAKGTSWGSNQVMECELLKQIAKARGKSVAQVCLRWVYEQGRSVLVKCFNEERLKENLHIFDWELSTQDSEMINQLPQKDFLELSSYQMSVLINLPRIYGMVKLLEHGKM